MPFFKFQKGFVLFFFIFFVVSFEIASAEVLNQILATVGTRSITLQDYEEGMERYKILSKFAPPNKKKSSFHTQVLDFLIDRILVDIAAEEESIQVNEKRLESELEKRMESMGVNNLETFKKNMAQQTGMPYEMWYKDLPYQIKKGQLLQIKVTPQMPTEQEIRNWYDKNKQKVGFEIKYREIVIAPLNDSIDEESKVQKELLEIRAKILKDPSLFRLIASGPRNDSRNRANGGLVNWVPAFEIYKQSRILAGIVTQTPPNRVSDIFRDEKKRYSIILVEGNRPTPIDAIRRGIQNILFRDKEENAFENWLENERKSTVISIFDPIYVKENNIKNPTESYELD